MAGLFLEWGCRQVLRAWHGLAEKQGFSLIIQPHAGQTSLHIDSDGLYLWFGRLSAGLLLGLTFVGITHSNLASLRRMAADPQVIMEYINNDYSICAFIGANQGPSQRVYLYSIDRNNECTTNRGDGWYYGLGGSLGRLNPGDVVAMAARNRGLTEEELASLLDFGAALGSQTSFQTGKDISGDTTVASICYRCAP
jgi:hypothetical protein